MIHRKIIVFQTGGTIASEHNEKSEEFGLRPHKGVHITEEIDGVEVEIFPLMSKDSSLMGDEDRIEIGEAVSKEIRKGLNVVITHGTDTLQDAACVLNYNLVYNPRRVVFTGSLYPIGTKFFDGEINFRDSVNFAAKGSEFSGIFTVMGGHVLDSHLWGKHLYRFHDPVIQHLQEIQERNGTKKVTILIPEPFDSLAIIKNGRIIKNHHKSAFYEVDGHFTVDRGSDGTMRGLDLRGPLPVSGRRADLHNHVPRSKKMSEVFNFLESYGNLKRLILNDEKNHKSVENEIEKLTKSIGFGSRKFIKSWRRLKPFFDRRCNLKKIFVIGDTASDLSVFIKNIENGDFDGFIVRGYGFGHANVDDPGSQEFFKVCEDSNIPVVITTGEGVPVSDEYEVARRLFYIYGCIPSGTLNDKEAQVRLASCIGHPEKVKFIHETAEEFGLEFLDIIRGYYIGGILFKTMNQRLRFERHFNMPTNVEIAASTLFTFEEKILLISMSLSYLQES